MIDELNNATISAAQEVDSFLSEQLNGITLDRHIKSRPDGKFAIYEIASPNQRFFRILDHVNRLLPDSNMFKDRLLLQPRSKKPSNIFETPEMHLLRRELTQSLTVSRNTFKEDFFNRYIPSVSNYEGDIVGRANFVVYGRRGAGKSSLLAYAMNQLKVNRQQTVWVAMQSLSGRDDVQATCSVLAEIFAQCYKLRNEESLLKSQTELETLAELDDDAAVQKKLTRITPRLRSTLQNITSYENPLTIFLDDFHVVDTDLQPEMLKIIYSISRDNNVFIKLSAIEALTRTWDASSGAGMQSPHDIQIMRLDYNLTMPDRSRDHIKEILNSHCNYCGFPNVNHLADESVLSRLVLAAAAVPRDAMSLFSQAINKSSIRKQKSVSITSINAAASENIEEKLKDFEQDLSKQKNETSETLEQIKEFCINKQKKNAFLVRIDNASPGFSLVQKLVALRFVHVLHEGTTPHKAGERYMAMMLDFGFYVGVRTARSVELFLDEPRALLATEIRKLPIFKTQ